MGSKKRRRRASKDSSRQPDVLDEYVEETREALRSLRRDLPGTADALSEVVKTTERAAHNLLAQVEEAMELDEASRELVETVLAGLYKRQGKSKEALGQVLEAYDRRAELLTQMMTELSFQDLTCQTIHRARTTIGELDQGLGAVVRDPARESSSIDPESRAGVDRLREAQVGGGRQSMVDDILNAR